jgi:hypothetical protein
LKKHPQWVGRFIAAVDRRKNDEFDWQSHNCLSFSAELFQAVTGKSAEKLFPKADCSTKRRAYAQMRKFQDGGMEKVGEKVAAHFGLTEVPPLTAQRGDLVVVDWDGEVAAGTVDLNGREVIVITPTKGLANIPIKHVVRAWRVG